MSTQQYLTFEELAVNDQFLLEGTNIEFIKMKPRPRSKDRPFACNAKTFYGNRTVKSGYILPETVVYRYDNGPFVWMDAEVPAPPGWLTATDVWSLQKTTHYQINTVSIPANQYREGEVKSILGKFVDELCIRLRNYYIKGKHSSGLSSRYVPVVQVHDEKGKVLNSYTQAVAKNIALCVQECSDFVNKEGAYSE